MSEYAGIQTQFQQGDGASPEVFTTIAQCGDINGPALVANTYDTTTHDNTLAGYKDFIPGLRDAGEVTVKLYFDATNPTHKNAGTGLLASFNSNTVHNYKIVPAGYSPTLSWTFSAFITKMGAFTYPVDGVQAAEVTFKIKGKPAKMLEA
jgi:hypothetical protein